MTYEYFLNRCMDEIFDTKTHTYYVGLATALPVEGKSIAEVSGSNTGYARVAITDLSDSNNGVVRNTSEIVFPTTTASWGTVVAYVVYDGAGSGANPLYANALTQTWALTQRNMQLILPVGELVMTLKEAEN